jgi:hypothetical protein
MRQNKNPKWWTTEHDSGWERVKAAFRRDWDQTKHDFGGKQPDTDQDVDDTVKQAAGKQPIPPRGVPTFEENEAAYKFGYGARRYYSSRYPSWNNELETRLREDWRSTSDSDDWELYEPSIRRGWEYDDRMPKNKAA